MPSASETIGQGVKETAQASSNPYAVAASVVLPFLLKQTGVYNDKDTQALRSGVKTAETTQGLLQGNLQASLRGDTTPAMQVILNRLQQEQRGQRQATAASLVRQNTGGGHGTGATFKAAQQSYQDEQFNQVMSNLLGQFQLSAQQTAAGQYGSLLEGQAALAKQEQSEIAGVNKQIAIALASQGFGDTVSGLFMSFIQKVFGTDSLPAPGENQTDLNLQDPIPERDVSGIKESRKPAPNIPL